MWHALASPSSASETRRRAFPQLVPPDRDSETNASRLPRRTRMDGKEKVVQPHRAALTEEEKLMREKLLKNIREFYVEHEIDTANLIQTKAEFSQVSTLVGRSGGWYEGRERHGEICIWNCSKIVFCNGQRNMEALIRFLKPSIGRAQMRRITTVGFLNSLGTV